jgi:hypothetical protein
MTYRRMYTDPYTAPSYCNLIFLANEKHTAHIGQGDRRYTVCARQDSPLQITKEEVKQFRAEWPTVATFFMNFDCDTEKARTPLDNAARRFVQDLSMDSNTQVFEAIIQGNFEFFITHWPEKEMAQSGVTGESKREDLITYRTAMVEIYDNRRTGRISRTAIESLVWHLTGHCQATAYKANKWINHHGMNLTRHRMHHTVAVAYEVAHWHISAEHEERMAIECQGEHQYTGMKAKQDGLARNQKPH